MSELEKNTQKTMKSRERSWIIYIPKNTTKKTYAKKYA